MWFSQLTIIQLIYKLFKKKKRDEKKRQEKGKAM
jgi:hypothetical protein